MDQSIGPMDDSDAPWPVPRHPAADHANYVGQFSPPFPVDALPESVRAFATSLAQALRVPSALTAVGCLSALAVLAGPRLCVQAREGFTEPLNLATVVALPPGSLKSPTFRAIAEPLHAIEREHLEQFRARRDKALAVLEDRLAESKGSQARTVAEQIKKTEWLGPAYLFAQDTTPEALAQLAARNGGVINMFDSEGTALGNITGRYNSGVPNLEFILAAYDCDRHRIGRVSAGHMSIERTCMTMALTTQPEVLHELHNPRTHMAERGMLGRIVPVIPQPTPDRGEDLPPPLDDGARRGWDRLLRSVAAIALPQVHDPLSEIERALPAQPERWWTDEPPVAAPVQPPRMQLSPEAARLHWAYERHMGRLRHPETGRLAYMADWVGKHYGRLLRVAGLLHLAEQRGGDEPIGLATMQRAVVICDWMLACARLAYGRWHDPTATVRIDQALAVRDWWITNGQPARFTTRSVMRSLAGRRWVRRADDVRAVLTTLGELGWWRREGLELRADAWVVNPLLYEQLDASRSTQLPGAHSSGDGDLTVATAGEAGGWRSYLRAGGWDDEHAAVGVAGGDAPDEHAAALAVVRRVNAHGDLGRVWAELIVGMPEFDEAATDAADPHQVGDRFVLRSGHLVQWVDASAEWVLVSRHT